MLFLKSHSLYSITLRLNPSFFVFCCLTPQTTQGFELSNEPDLYNEATNVTISPQQLSDDFSVVKVSSKEGEEGAHSQAYVHVQLRYRK